MLFGNKNKLVDHPPADDPAEETTGNTAEKTHGTDESAGVEDEIPGFRDKQIDIEVENPGKRRRLIITLTWPSLAENFLSALMSMVDMMMVGVLGAYAINAVGLVMQPRFIMMAAFMAMNVGTTALVAQSKGARNRDGANMAMNQALILAVGMSLVICTIMTILSEPLIRLIAGSELEEASIIGGITYFRIQIYGLPTATLTFAMNASLRGAGNTRTTFYNNAVANIVNVCLNYCLIGGNFGFPRLEVAGASIATVIGQFVGFLMALRVVLGRKQYVRLYLKNCWKVNISMIRRIVNIGIPSFIEQIIMRAGTLFFTTIVTALGDLSYAAHMVAMNVHQLAFTTGMAFGTAATTLVGQSIGRKRIDLAKKYVGTTQKLGLIVSFIIALLLFTCGRLIAGLYSDKEEILVLAASMMKIIALVTPTSNARQTYISALRGAGDAKFMAVVSFIGVLMLRPLVALLLVNVLKMGLVGVWIALSSDFVVSFFITLARFRREKWTKLVI